MKFNQIVLEKLGSILRKRNFNISQQWNNFLMFNSENLAFIVGHNERENSNNFSLSGDGRHSFEIDDEMLKDFFKSELKLTSVPIDIFVNNLILFFENEGKPLLDGDMVLFKMLDEFNLQRSHRYTQDLMKKR